MLKYTHEVIVNWGDSDPFGLVYFPRMMSWFNDAEHNMFRNEGYPVNKLIQEYRTAFVMGEIHFRFIGPAAYGDEVISTIELAEIGKSTLHWKCLAVQATNDTTITEGTAIRIYAEIQEDGNLKSLRIPDDIRKMLVRLGFDGESGLD